MSNERLDQLKKALHPEKPMDIIEQCKIVAEALSDTGDYVENNEELALRLKISESKVYQMNYIHYNLIDPLKDYFKNTKLQCHSTYDKAKLPPKAQTEYLKEKNLILTGSDSLESLINETP